MSGVGPVLEASLVGHAVATALRERNPGCHILDRGAYLRVSCEHVCVLERAHVEALLGEPFELPGALEQVMPSFAGRLELDSDTVVWRGA